MGKIQKNLVKKQFECFSAQYFGSLYFDTLTKNTTFMTKVIGFWLLSPWFLVSISLVFDSYLTC